MTSEKSIRPVPPNQNLTDAEEFLRRSRGEQQVRDFLRNTPWSDGEAAERNYGWPTPPATRPNLEVMMARGSFVVYFDKPVKDAEGNVVNMVTSSVSVDTIEEARKLEGMSDEEIGAYAAAVSLVEDEIEE